VSPGILSPLLPPPDQPVTDWSGRIWRALHADPALAGRVEQSPTGSVRLLGPNGGEPPASQKERACWELHVRLRLATDVPGLPEEYVPALEWLTVAEPEARR